MSATFHAYYPPESIDQSELQKLTAEYDLYCIILLYLVIYVKFKINRKSVREGGENVMARKLNTLENIYFINEQLNNYNSKLVYLQTK